jgi:hypothetical protein
VTRVAWFGAAQLGPVGARDVERFVMEPVAPATRNNALTAVRSFFRWAHKLELVAVDLRLRRFGVWFAVVVVATVAASTLHAREQLDAARDQALRQYGEAMDRDNPFPRRPLLPGTRSVPIPPDSLVTDPSIELVKEDLRLAACRSDAVIVGRLRNSSGHLTPSRRQVFSIHDVVIETVLAPLDSSSLERGDIAYILRGGGDVGTDTERITYIPFFALPLEVGGRFLLFLKYSGLAVAADPTRVFEAHLPISAIRLGQVQRVESYTAGLSKIEISEQDLITFTREGAERCE